MTDSPKNRSEENETDLFATPGEEAKLLGFSELLFFAYRDFTGDPDEILQVLDFGRAHHRVVHFVNRQPGLRVADLLELLKITKQSLGRVLRQLIDTGYVRQVPGSQDRRERLLFLTDAGEDLAKRLAAPQLVRFSNALKAAGPDAEIVVRRFLQAMANPVSDPKTRPQTAAIVSEDLDVLDEASKPSDDGHGKDTSEPALRASPESAD